jgi:hypothetical protein
MPQVFLIIGDGTTEELASKGQIKDILKTNECYVIVADDVRKVYLWKGVESNVRSKFIGARMSQEIRGQVGMNYAVVPLDESEETDEFLKIIGGKTEAGYAKGVKAEKEASAPGGGGGAAKHPMREKQVFDAPRPAAGMKIAGSKPNYEQSGPLYTGKESMAALTAEPEQINFDAIMEKLEEVPIPDGYERELIIIGNHAYSIVEKVQTFLGKKQSTKEIEQVGSIPEGIFFAEGYSPRVLSEGGKIVAVEFLKITRKDIKIAPEYKDKRKILKNQIKSQLGGLGS